jgi:hypothetical protein
VSRTPRTPHHVVAEPTGPVKTTIDSFSKGQVFIRQGAPHMRVDIGSGVMHVCNLLTGAVWDANVDEFVEPAYHVKLRYERSAQC